jgi:hypothetical protein
MVLFEIIAACLSQNKLEELERFQSATNVNFNTLISIAIKSLTHAVLFVSLTAKCTNFQIT